MIARPLHIASLLALGLCMGTAAHAQGNTPPRMPVETMPRDGGTSTSHTPDSACRTQDTAHGHSHPCPRKDPSNPDIPGTRGGGAAPSSSSTPPTGNMDE
ncbi:MULTISPECIES: hypothetical protein [Komagataeibacter]|uniref:Uncharacterized protein n=2 Tax=Komagataeibacter TaxID=1434011 RepID=A0A318R317_9PROT|nr:MULTISPECIES: hypothetical protein [Komagataeibacter]MBL7232641.1 hypothetical protein [Komagataeibacter oboediens]MBT0676087.1 hypothetical protein [Komagataeibacter oboediens]MBT0679650.1 hypothetical protein [Komagataeibacter oboediens]MBV0888790.1 hypothetical protein [Komagataeibacter oboediens]MBV1823979.1 hypothetical protein [Komagataeibacter oboediens]